MPQISSQCSNARSKKRPDLETSRLLRFRLQCLNVWNNEINNFIHAHFGKCGNVSHLSTLSTHKVSVRPIAVCWIISSLNRKPAFYPNFKNYAENLPIICQSWLFHIGLLSALDTWSFFEVLPTLSKADSQTGFLGKRPSVKMMLFQIWDHQSKEVRTEDIYSIQK